MSAMPQRRALAKAGQPDDYHVRQFEGTADRTKLLQRYSKVGQFRNRKELLRHACHVCTWILHLPDADVVSVVGGLSCVGVLSKMLQSRGRGPLTPRLQVLLGRLRIRVASGLSCSQQGGENHLLWKELNDSLPGEGKKRTRAEVFDTVKAPIRREAPTEYAMNSSQNAEAEGRRQRALRRFNRQKCRLGNLVDMAQRSQEVIVLLSKAREAYNEGDARALCHLLLRGSAWLAKPRVLSHAATGERMTEAAKLEIRTALQTKIRAAILFCLRGIDLDDSSTLQRMDIQVSLQHIRNLMTGVDLGQVMSSKQWHAILSLLTNSYGQNGDMASAKGDMASANGKRTGRMALRGRLSDMASVKGDTYTPSLLLQRSPRVERGDAVIFTCSGCKKPLKSDWYFRKSSGDCHVIVPGSGHSNTKTSRCGYYHTEDAVKRLSDFRVQDYLLGKRIEARR